MKKVFRIRRPAQMRYGVLCSPDEEYYYFATQEEADRAVRIITGGEAYLINNNRVVGVDVDDTLRLNTVSEVADDDRKFMQDWWDQPFFTATPLSEYFQNRQIDEEKEREQLGIYTPRSSNSSSFPTQSSSQLSSSRPSPSSDSAGCLVPLLIGFSSMILSLVTIAFCFAGLMTVSGCGPSESQVQKDFNRMASRRGIPISGSARVNKMRRVRVDGERKEVWSVNYDVPNADGTKTWKTSYMTYEDGKPKVIRTDTQGRVR